MIPAPIQDDTNSSFLQPDVIFRRFTLAEIKSATNNFDESLVIGRGGFGKVYKSLTKFGSGSEVAIKRLHSMSSQGANEFETEVKILHKLRHGKLVQLIGYCSEGQEMVLAYEFMPNGTLEDHLHQGYTELSWLQRLKICIGAARGLDYLHTGTSTQHGVIHRDVKTSNILLDANFAAKISDFGLAKIGPINQTRTFVKTGVKGTFGYMDPSYFYSGKLTRKSDVYAFGVVLLEVLCGRQAVDDTLDDEQHSLVAWARDQIKKGKLDGIVDHRIMQQVSKKCLKDFASIAVKCLHDQPTKRLTMAEVVVRLESILSQERKSPGSGVDEGRLINKVRYFFATKTELMPVGAVGSSLYSIEKPNNQCVSTYTYAELVSATKNFEYMEYSTTSHDIVYKGWVDENTHAPSEPGVGLAMYVLKRHIGKCKLELKPEEYDYPNLVKLLGYCLEEQDLFCVYELIADHTSLDKLLFGGTTTLSWTARLGIALQAAQGLSFLHQRNCGQAYSRFKATHILVDSDYDVRLSNYEVGKLFVDLNNFAIQLLSNDNTMKREIYDFGVVLLEILTGMDFDEHRAEGKRNLVEWASPLLKHEENLEMVMDPFLQQNNSPPKGAFKLALLVSNCLQPTKAQRPSMEEIFQALYMMYQEETNEFESENLKALAHFNY